MGMLFGQNGIGFHRLGEGFALPLPQTLLQTIRLPQWVGLRRKRAHREPPRLESLEPRTLLAATPYISEFMANNDSILADQDGAFSDWIEIANPDVAKVNLNGYYLTDDAALLNKWKLPAVDLPAGGYMVVFASGKNRALAGSQLHTNFELNDAGEYLALVAPDGQTILSDFTPEYPQQLMDKSYGISKNLAISPLLPTGSPLRVMIPANGNLGTAWKETSFDHTSWTSGMAGAGFDINTGPARLSGFTVRMVNVSGQITDVSQAEAILKTPFPSGWVLQQDVKADYLVVNHGDGASDFQSNQLLPNGLPADEEYVLEATADVVIPQGSWTFNVGSDDGFKLTLSNGTFTSGLNNFSYPSLRGHANTSATINVGAGGLSAKLTLVFYENGGGDDVELSVASAGSGSLVLLSDGVLPGWSVKTTSSTPPPDYLPLIKTSLDSSMRNKNPSAYIRVPLKEVINPTDYDLLKLRMKYDDGFVVYLNGQKIAEKNAPANPLWNSTATAAHADGQAIVFEEFEIPLPAGLLQAGSGNVLAIQGLNQTVSEGDFLIYPEMDGVKILGTAPRYFARPTPGQPNDISSLTEIVKDTKFSYDRGFYDTPFNLTIMTATPGAQIRYTLDGSAPTATTGIVFDPNDPDPAKRTIRIDKTTTIRAAAFKPDAIGSNVDTQTYIFLDDVIHQSPTGTPPAGWPTGPVNGQVLDYGMDTDVVNDPTFGPQLKDALKSLPTFSVVMDINDMFGPAGIYTNSGQDGRQWERPMSLELLYPDGTDGFHINGGVRIRGGYSRSTGNPKHALRFFFRDEYGEGKLNYPMFGADAAQEFAAFDLRTFQNYSWSFGGDGRGIFMRDQFNRDLQLAMNDPATRGNYYHLYINGQYWGLYNTEERSEAEYAASYFGGVKEDYDVIKVEAGPYTINATDGNMEAWTRLWNQAIGDMSSNANYMKLMGLNVDGTRNPGYEVLLDADNLIDYMLLIYWGGNFDAPLSWFLGESAPNNWYGIRNRNGQEGFKFFIHDAEHTLVDPNSGDVNVYLAVDRTNTGAPGTDLSRSNPTWLLQHLMENAEFRLHVADRVHKWFFNDGPLAPTNATTLFNKRKNEIYKAVVAESARWGDAQRGGGLPLTRNDWLAEVNRLLNVYFPQRTTVVLNQLKTDLLYTAIAAPEFNQHGGIIGSAFNLTLRNPDGIGTIYYTTDGADPRKLYGALNTPSAKAYSAAIALTGTTTVKARILDAGRWSALTEAVFHHDLSSLKVTELMYNPAPPRPAELAVNPLFTAQDFEFVEIRNTGSTQLDIGGVSFSAGLTFTFPAGTKLAAGTRVVLAKNASAFAARYPGITLGGIYTGSLDNGGERLVLSAPGGKTIFDFTYGDWYSITDGEGYSLVPINTAGDYNNKDNWRPSNKLYGAPGADDPGFLPDSVVINEALTHTDQPAGDWIELHNTTNGTLDLSGWFLSDSDLDLQKYQIPQGTVISPGGYVVLTQAQHFGLRFGLSEYGEEIFLSSNDGANPGGYREHVDFGAADREVTFGRYLKSTGGADFVPMAAPTLGSANALPRVGPVIISEIMYYPSAGGDEYVELLNLAGSDMPLYDPLNPQNPWKFTEGIDYTFPADATLPAFGYGLIVGIDPAAFRAKYSIPADVPIFGPFVGLLENNGENLKLAMPGAPDPGVPLPYITVDQVNYKNSGAWPPEAYGTGPSLARKSSTAYGNDAVNWAAGPMGGTPGGAFVAPAAPSELSAAAVNMALVRLTWIDNSTRELGYYIERSANGITFAQVGQVGPDVTTFDDGKSVAPGTFYTYRVRAYNAVGNSDYSNTFSATTPNIQTLPLVAANDAWRYNENRADPGATWITTGYNDAVSPWKSGPGPLGLDGDFPAGTFNTPLAIGNTNDRTKAFYFRKHFNLPVVPADVADLQIRLFIDDGAAVYINGNPLPYLYQMDAPPQGSRLTYDSLANNTVGNAIWDGWFSLPAEMRSALVAGDNVIAVETHQANTGSSDIVFAMELQAIVSATTVSADIVNVSPDPTPDPINSITIQFSEKVNGFDRLDLRLTRDDAAADRLTDQQTLSSADGITWTLNNVAAVTALAGRYTLKLSANGAGIVGTNTDRVLGADAIDVFKSTRMALTGSSGNDIYYVRVANSCLEIFPTVPPGLMPAWRFPLTDITSLSIDAGGGNDLLQIVGNMPFTIPFIGGDGTDRLILDGGTFAFAANLAGPASIEELVATSTATVNFTTSQTLASLTLSNSARVSLAAGGTLLLRTSGLSITNSASLDLNDNDLIVQAQSATRDTVLFQVNNLIRIARNDGVWDAPGLTSTTARNRADGLTGLAAALNDNGGGAKLWTNEDANAILVKYTWNGDVNLDGAINLNDYFLIDSGYLAKGKNYISGDVNYDGGVNLNDYFLIDSAYLAQSGLLNTTIPAASTAPPPRKPLSPAARPKHRRKSIRKNRKNPHPRTLGGPQ
jgi:hypothetical protein